MKLETDIYSLNYWAQEQFFKNTDGSINTGALQIAWPNGQAKTKFQSQLVEAGYSELPQPRLTEDAPVITYDQFVELYEFGVPVRNYILLAAEKGFRLERQTLFTWVKSMRPEKVDYGRNYHQV